MMCATRQQAKAVEDTTTRKRPHPVRFAFCKRPEVLKEALSRLSALAR